MGIFSQNLTNNLSPDMISTELTNMSQSLPFFPLKMTNLLAEGPTFVKSFGEPSPVINSSAFSESVPSSFISGNERENKDYENFEG